MIFADLAVFKRLIWKVQQVEANSVILPIVPFKNALTTNISK